MKDWLKTVHNNKILIKISNNYQKSANFLMVLVTMIVLKKSMDHNRVNNTNVFGIAIIIIMIKNVFKNVRIWLPKKNDKN